MRLVPHGDDKEQLSKASTDVRVENDPSMTSEEYSAYLAKKKFLDDPANRHLLVDDCTPVVRDERKCDFEIMKIERRSQKKVEVKVEQVEEDIQSDELSLQLESWERQWKGDLKVHTKRMVHEITYDPRDPGMKRMLEQQNISQVFGQKLIDRIHLAVEVMGDQLFANMKANYSKIYQRGMFTTDQTVTRLLASFKIELRNSLTPDTVRQKVLLGCMEEFFGSSEEHIGGGMTMNRFKLEAMDRLFDARDAAQLPSRVARERKYQHILDQIEEFEWTTQSHLLSYCGLNSEDSLRMLRKILLLLCRMPFLDIVPIAFKADMARATSLKHFHPGDTISIAKKVSHSIYMLLEGRVDIIAADGVTSSKDCQDNFVWGEKDVLMGKPNDVDVLASSNGATLALLSKSIMEEILKQSFNPSSLLEKNSNKIVNAFGSSPIHMAVRPHHQKTHPSSDYKTHKSIAHIAKVAKAIQTPRLHRELIQRTRCTESKKYSEEYIQKNRASIEATISAEKPQVMAESTQDQALSDPWKKTASPVLMLTQMKQSAQRKIGEKGVHRPAFEFFPTFLDRFDPQDVEVLFLDSRPFPMDEMRLKDIGPPCPEPPSFLMPPRVEIDTAVLLLDQLRLLCKTSSAEGRRQSVDPSINHTMNFYPHEAGVNSDVLDSLPPLSLAWFIDGRKRITAATLRSHKTPFASVSLYCTDWNMPHEEVVEPTAVENEDGNTFVSNDIWMCEATQAISGNDTEHTPMAITPTASTRSSTQRQAPSKIDEQMDNSKQIHQIDQKDAPEQIRHRQRSSSTQVRERKESERPESTSQVQPSNDNELLSPRSFITDVEQDYNDEEHEDGEQAKLDENNNDPSNDDNKHMFKVKKLHKNSTTLTGSIRRGRESSRQLVAAAQSQSRREVYQKVVKHMSQASVEVQDPLAHLKQLEIEQKLEHELGKVILEDGKPCPWRIQLQKRMEHVLSSLQLTARRKLAVVMKYTQKKYSPHFESALDLWEKAATCILDREATLLRVYEFELVASDPRRLFNTISTLRLKEQRQRDRHTLLLNNHTKFCRAVLIELEELYGDVVYFQDRLYTEKMLHDYTELLYNLEQVRLRVYFGGIQPDVPTQTGGKNSSIQNSQGSEAMDRKHGYLQENTQLNYTQQPHLLEMNDSTILPVLHGIAAWKDTSKNTTPKDSTNYSMEIAVAIKRDNSEQILDVKSSQSHGSYNGRLRRIVKERGDADLNALKEELNRKYIEKTAAEAAIKLEKAQEKINRRRNPTRPTNPKPAEKSMQELLSEILGKFKQKKELTLDSVSIM